MFKVLGPAGGSESCPAHLSSLKSCDLWDSRRKAAAYQAIADDIDGWMATLHLDVVLLLNDVQMKACIRGGIAEIGVHHGKVGQHPFVFIYDIIHACVY